MAKPPKVGSPRAIAMLYELERSLSLMGAGQRKTNELDCLKVRQPTRVDQLAGGDDHGVREPRAMAGRCHCSGDFAPSKSAKSPLVAWVSGAARMRCVDLSGASTPSPQDHLIDVIVRSAVCHVLRAGVLDRECCRLVKDVGRRRLVGCSEIDVRPYPAPRLPHNLV
jgi:hypothetical protein